MTDIPTEERIHLCPAYKGLVFGVELEIEAEGLYYPDEVYDEEDEAYHTIDPVIPKGWSREQEDSIQGVELISAMPVGFEESVENIERLFADIKKQGYMPIRTPRGSTHVHVNVADLTWTQMAHFMVACAWAEPALIELAGKGRKCNLFAQSYDTTPLGWNPAIQWIRKRRVYQNVDTHYMATSFYPMAYLGSVEFRMGASARTADEAITWLSYINAVAEDGRTLPITDAECPPFMDFLTGMLDEKVRERVIRKGARNAREVWQALQEPYEPPVVRGRKKKAPNVIFDDLTEIPQAIAVTPVPTLAVQSVEWNGGDFLPVASDWSTTNLLINAEFQEDISTFNQFFANTTTSPVTF